MDEVAKKKRNLSQGHKKPRSVNKPSRISKASCLFENRQVFDNPIMMTK